MRIVKVVNQTRGNTIGDNVEVADAAFTRMKGLLGRKGVSAGGGLWIKPSSGVHTIGMQFPIDVVGLDAERRVIRLWQDLVPFRITSVSTRLRSVVELSSGHIAASGIQLGDTLTFEEAE